MTKSTAPQKVRGSKQGQPDKLYGSISKATGAVYKDKQDIRGYTSLFKRRFLRDNETDADGYTYTLESENAVHVPGPPTATAVHMVATTAAALGFAAAGIQVR